ncbi:Hpt domain-containing protein [Bryocella elongata]|uniref:Hpt domain-containing protein n=2 Tax=Bryocella elongata TaxID=863522 RepID=A0A1H5W7U2_9BACT|nr:Hpt domain-containing protein [Bryocella elongata]
MGQDTAIAGLQVLIIEDDVVVRELLEMLLPMEGHSILSAASAAEGLALLEQHKTGINVVLCDLHLPDMGPAELGSRLRAICPPSVLLIGMSATQATTVELQSFDDFLLKPFQPGELTAAVVAAKVRDGSSAHLPHAAADSVTGGASVSEEVGLEIEAADRAATPALDEAIFATLSATLPGPQLLELYNLTVQDVAQRVERMSAARASGDLDLYRREAHAIKGGCGMVGAVELRDLATLAEGGAPECTPPIEDFMRACARLRRMLNVRLT